MTRITVTVPDDFYEDIHALSRRLDAPIAGIVRYSVDRAFYDEMDEIFCVRKVRESYPEITTEDTTPVNSDFYRSRHDWRMAKVMEFLETLPYVNP
jgi:hypothetical protein